MNRETRRKTGISKETSDKLDHLKQPCTILEVIQLAQGVSQDAIKNYHENINPIIVSLSIQIELLKDILTESGVLNNEEFITKFNERVEEYNKQKAEAISQIEEEVNKTKVPKTEVVPGDVEVKVTN